MDTFLVLLAVAYFVVGLSVYFLTDVTKFARGLEKKLVVIPRRMLNNNLFLFVVALWPLWLFLKDDSDS